MSFRLILIATLLVLNCTSSTTKRFANAFSKPSSTRSVLPQATTTRGGRTRRNRSMRNAHRGENSVRLLSFVARQVQKRILDEEESVAVAPLSLYSEEHAEVAALEAAGGGNKKRRFSLMMRRLSVSGTSSTSRLFQSTSASPSDGEGESSGQIANWKEKLLQISNIASLLCVIDCTVLPIITIALPLIGLGASAATADWLHHFGHQMALYFVLPVGGLAATMNYTTHKNKPLSSLSLLGLLLIYSANAPSNFFPIKYLSHSLQHALHCGTLLHKAVNLSGCALLLGSNYFGHRLGCSHGSSDGGDCGHDHSHHHHD